MDTDKEIDQSFCSLLVSVKDGFMGCSISEVLFSKLELNPNLPLVISVGNKQETIYCWHVDKNITGFSISFSSELQSKLYLPTDTTLNIKVKDENQLRLGPVIAVFVSNGQINKLKRCTPLFRIEELAKANSGIGTLLYFFSIKDIDWINQTIQGFSFIEQINSWVQTDFPFPEALYDRGGGFLPNQQFIASYIRNQLNNIPKLKTLNCRHTFSKWQNHEVLSEYIPENTPATIKYTFSKDLKNMLLDYKTVYLKSYYGNNGREVMQVEKIKRRFSISFFSAKKGEVITKKVSSLRLLSKEIKSFFGKKSLIIQQGISLLKLEQNNVDIRVLVQKNWQGKWECTAMPVRVALNRCPVTSTCSGSEVFDFFEFFYRKLKFDKERIQVLQDEIKTVSYKTVAGLEQFYGDFCEIGIDIGLDTELNVFVIEANAKPGKDTVYRLNKPLLLRKTFSLPLEYALRLTGYIVK